MKKICPQCKQKKNIAKSRKICEACRDHNYKISSGQIRKPDYPKTTTAGYKEPMIPVEDGFGFYGAITATKDNKHIQCHECGYFFQNLATHVNQGHKMSTKDYKEKFGLRLKDGLVS